MRTHSIALALLISFVPVALPTLAIAQPIADDATTKAARARFQEGVEAFDKGQYENARAAFLQAYALRKHPAVLLNLAQSSLKSGHAIESLKYFQQYLRESANLTPQQKADAEKGIAEARTKLGRLEISAPTGAEISVDNDRVGNAPLSEPVDVEVGSHSVRARYADGTAEGKTVGVNIGEKMTVKFGASAGAAVVPVPGVVPTPPASVPASPPQAPPPQDAVVSPAPTPPPPGADTGAAASKKNLFAPPKTMIPVYVGGAMVALGVIDAVVFAIFKADAQSKADSVANEIRTHKNPSPPSNVCGPPVKNGAFAGACAALQDNNNKVDQDALFANIGIGVAVAGAVLGVGWYLLAPKKEDAAPPLSAWKSVPKIAPMLGTSTRGLSLTGEF